MNFFVYSQIFYWSFPYFLKLSFFCLFEIFICIVLLLTHRIKKTSIFQDFYREGANIFDVCFCSFPYVASSLSKLLESSSCCNLCISLKMTFVFQPVKTESQSIQRSSRNSVVKFRCSNLR